MFDAAHIVILLATHNGARFIEEQIWSIQKQTVSNWKLLVRDDASQDGTLELLADLARGDERIHLVAKAHGRLGIVGNFAELMRIAHAEGADYTFFADQDDVWASNKLADQLTHLLKVRSEEHTSELQSLAYLVC